MSVLIKICGVKTPEIAFEAAKLGADLVGVVFAKHSRRCVGVVTALEIVAAVHQAGAKVVGVFAEHDAETINDLYHCMQLDYVQLHGAEACAAVSVLNKAIPKIYVPEDNKDKIASLSCDQDFFLFDAAKPGGGQVWDWKNFKAPSKMPWFLAGGLNVSNVRQAIEQLKPNGVDVSSGVEDAEGKKDLERIREFILKVKN